MTPAQVRARRARVRTVGKALVAVGIVAGGIALVVLLIDVAVIGVPGATSVFCGADVAPALTIGIGTPLCASALAEQALIGFTAAAVAVVAGIVGAVIWIRARD